MSSSEDAADDTSRPADPAGQAAAEDPTTSVAETEVDDAGTVAPTEAKAEKSSTGESEAGESEAGTSRAEKSRAGTASGKQWRRPTRTVIAAAIAAVLVIALSVTTGFTASWHFADQQREQLDDQYRDVARRGMLNLISLDSERVDRDVDRILELSTGEFRTDFAARSQDFIEVVQKLKVSTEGTVNAVGLESSNEQKAVAMLSATSLVTNTAGAEAEPRIWRMRVHLINDDGTVLIEKVDFAV